MKSKSLWDFLVKVNFYLWIAKFFNALAFISDQISYSLHCSQFATQSFRIIFCGFFIYKFSSHVGGTHLKSFCSFFLSFLYWVTILASYQFKRRRINVDWASKIWDLVLLIHFTVYVCASVCVSVCLWTHIFFTILNLFLFLQSAKHRHYRLSVALSCHGFRCWFVCIWVGCRFSGSRCFSSFTSTVILHFVHDHCLEKWLSNFE